MRGVPSGYFGGGHGEGVVAKTGDQVEPAAGCLDVAGEASIVATPPRSICDTRPGVTPMAAASWA